MNVWPRLLATFPLLLSLALRAQLLPGYNSAYYPTVMQAVAGVTQSFLLRQGYAKQAGVTSSGPLLVYNGITYTVNQVYQNGGAGYLVATTPATAPTG